jgi:hypothetical protein
MMPFKKASGLLHIMLLCCLPAIALPQATGAALRLGGPNADAAREVQLSGKITRKGSDADPWWALQTESGTLYRLEFLHKSLEKSLFEWQYRDVHISGTIGRRFLSVDVVHVREAHLLNP